MTTVHPQPQSAEWTEITPILATAPTETLYSDAFITLTSIDLKISYYYFPVGLPLTIPLSEIERIESAEKYSFFSLKTWGMSFSWIWWAADLGRYGPGLIRDKKCLVVAWKKDDTLGKGFTVKEPEKFWNAWNQIKPSP